MVRRAHGAATVGRRSVKIWRGHAGGRVPQGFLLFWLMVFGASLIKICSDNSTIFSYAHFRQPLNNGPSLRHEQSCLREVGLEGEPESACLAPSSPWRKARRPPLSAGADKKQTSRPC